MRALLIDAYDSFVFIIEQYLRALDLQTTVLRCDDPRIGQMLDVDPPDFIVLGQPASD